MIVIIYCIIFSLLIYSNDYNYDSNDLKYTNIFAGLELVYEKIEGRDFDGDGFIYREYYIEEDIKLNTIINEIQKIKGWKKGIIYEDFYYLLNNGAVDKSVIGRECYYYFKDRYRYYDYVNDVYDYKESIMKIKGRFLENYTAMIFDVENRKIYYYVFDI